MVNVNSEKLILTAAVLTAAGTVIAKAKQIYKGCVVSVRWLRDQWGFHSKVLRALEDQGRSIANIQSELKPNGGASLRDAINQIRDMANIADVRSHLTREACPYAMYECSPDGKCVWVNEALCNLFGMEEERMMGYGWLEAIEDSERIDSMKAWQQAIENNIPYSSSYTVVNQRTGERYRCRTRANGYKHEGKTLLYAGTVTKEVADGRKSAS